MRISLVLSAIATLSFVACSSTNSKVALPESFVQMISPIENSIVKSPLIVKGKAHGNWFFEGSLPVQLLDAEGNTIAQAPGMAQGEWMTTDWVEFSAELVFTTSSDHGTLVIRKDNPSGLPENDAIVSFPILFR